MRNALVIVLFAVSALAQQESVMSSSACGSKSVSFDFKLDESQHVVASPETAKARAYFIQDIGAVNCLGSCSSRIGLDGTWIGANQRNSYFSVSVEPGEHHVCVSLNSRFAPHTVAFAHFSAEVGKTYYFRVRPFSAKDQLLNIDPVDSDEAKYLIANYPLSLAVPKP
jgi:hypothetical protein